MYLLVHTMTVTQIDCVMVAQFFHMLNANRVNANLQLVAKRVRINVHPSVLGNRSSKFVQLQQNTLRSITKRKYSHVKHHIRTFKIVSPNRVNNEFTQKIDECVNNNTNNGPSTNLAVLPRCASDPNLLASEEQESDINKQINPDFTVQQISQWLSCNRFNNYLQTFAGFSGSDMLRMSKEDLIQICGQADGIRLFNALHSKSIAPKLTLYICRENTNLFHAVYLTTNTSAELCQKLTNIIGVANEQIRNVYFQGPQGIHVHVNDDVICHIKEESMFSLDIVTDNNGYNIIILKPIVK